MGALRFSPPLAKGDEGGFKITKSPLTPLFQRGEIAFPSLLKKYYYSS
jgi:hypothetical protein